VPTEVTLARESCGELGVYPVVSARQFGVEAFFTDRFGGVSEAPYDTLNLGDHVGDDVSRVSENRRRVARACGIDPQRLIVVRQVHSSEVLEVTGPVNGSQADALVSSTEALALAVLVADCVPVLVVDEASPLFGVVHAGWRGLYSGVLAAALSRFEDPASLHVFLGPCISLAAYQVGPEVARHFTSIPMALLADQGDRSRLDLRRVAAAQLSELGIADERIEVSTQTTDGGATFFSDRGARPCGRFALVAKRGS
jgi:YfiH family protein